MFNKAIKISPNNPDAFNNKGNALYDLNNYNEAIECYDAALAIDSNNAEARVNKENALKKRDKK